MSVFGFSTETASGDFTPILKYDARAGRLFRIDRVDNGGGFENDPIDITTEFKAIVDFENVEVGWIDFVAGSAPHCVLVKMGEKLPPRPSDRHKNGVRFLVRLAKACIGPTGKATREVMGTAQVFLRGIEAVYKAYQAEKAKNPGKLPVIALEKTTPIKSGSGERTSTNYQPVFKIVSWAPRGDLVFTPKGSNAAAANGNGSLPLEEKTPPSTGSTKVDPPKSKAKEPETADAEDFG
jgi:hypothetical protein